ncbi:MAG: PorT family protein [Saprospiraceae bacterium]|nr:PorT family protein [Saprospiraceae bacterium]
MRCSMYLILFCFGITKLNAQSSNWFAGIHVSNQISWIFNSFDSDEGGELDYVLTLHPSFGLDLGYRLDPHFAIQTGFIYSAQGQKYETAGNEDADYKTDLTYLKIPLLLDYRSKPLGKMGLVLQGGFQLALLSTAESSRENVFGYYSSLYKDVKDFYESTAVDFVLGLGAEYKSGSHVFRLVLRADYSLTDIERTEKKPGLRGVSSNATVALPMLSYLHSF